MVSLSLYIDGIICFLMIFYYLFNMELHAADVQNRQWANYCWELLELSDLMAFCSRAPRSSSGWWNRPELRHRRVSLFKKKKKKKSSKLLFALFFFHTWKFATKTRTSLTANCLHQGFPERTERGRHLPRVYTDELLGMLLLQRGATADGQRSGRIPLVYREH